MTNWTKVMSGTLTETWSASNEGCLLLGIVCVTYEGKWLVTRFRKAESALRHGTKQTKTFRTFEAAKQFVEAIAGEYLQD